MSLLYNVYIRSLHKFTKKNFWVGNVKYDNAANRILEVIGIDDEGGEEETDEEVLDKL